MNWQQTSQYRENLTKVLTATWFLPYHSAEYLFLNRITVNVAQTKSLRHKAASL
jgi:hypothetical protein